MEKYEEELRVCSHFNKELGKGFFGLFIWK